MTPVAAARGLEHERYDVRNITAESVTTWIIDYLKNEKRYSGSWSDIEQRARRSGKTVYDLLCEIEDTITYQELLRIFSKHTGIEEATSIEGKILHVEEGRVIYTNNDSEDPVMTRNCYFWHPLAIKGALQDNQIGQNDIVYLVTRELFARTSIFSSPVNAQTDLHQQKDFDKDVWEVITDIVKAAIKIGATDIHLFPVVEKEIYRLRYRVLGDLVDAETYSLQQGKSLLNVIINQAKRYTPSLKTDEKRKPMDGKIIIPRTDIRWHNDVDLRVSIMWKPDMENADVVLRVLAKSDIGSNTIEHLGFSEEHAEKLRMAISRTRGIILVTGGTGTGKSKTVNTMLAGLPMQKNILSVEDPIEYLLPNGRQFQIFEWEDEKSNREAVGFAELARQCKRHDPDVIFIGELRDRETVETAIHLSKTGHLVLATLHVARATMIPQTLIEDYGVSVDALADNLVLGVNQVLSKRLCPECKQGYVLSELPPWYRRLRFPNTDQVEKLRNKELFEPGCDAKCRCAMNLGSETIMGYAGRCCVAEVYEFSPQNFEEGKISSFQMEKILDPGTNILADMVMKIENGLLPFDSLRSLL